ncbi:FAD-dependent monooxygenase [Dactylosporangium sp. NBC_01737]|uniref:FAD-dependent monooxygenase n=1 Tax=Dactylosporangium sp. NBC_01737 TaxID=2975959 RepID=UPI002E137270|nr:FAD-dependent monooxygenase [Dactylosporangium sp. NBC_01737]
MRVLVVGAGPAGLTTAVTIARYGVPVLLVERRADTTSLPRATAVSTRTMELFRSWGIEERVRAAGPDVSWQARVARNLTAPDGVVADIGFPTREQALAVSPTWPACVPQDALEEVLLEHLRGFPNVRVHQATEVTDLHDGPGGPGGTVLARLRDRRTDVSRIVAAAYVVGADGPRSVVRDAAGIGTEGPGVLADYSSTMFHAPLWEHLGERRHGIYPLTDPAVSGVLLPAGGDRWVYGRETDGRDGTVDLLRAATGVADLRPRITREARFTFTVRLAQRYRTGRMFLAGDAAHQITPRGGTGMNTAIHDGHDLGWKLAWVLLGWAGPQLLDTYETERRPVGLRNAARSAQPDGSYRAAAGELANDLGGRLPHAWLDRDGTPVSTLDLLGPRSTLLVGPRYTGSVTAGDAPPGRGDGRPARRGAGRRAAAAPRRPARRRAGSTSPGGRRREPSALAAGSACGWRRPGRHTAPAARRAGCGRRSAAPTGRSRAARPAGRTARAHLRRCRTGRASGPRPGTERRAWRRRTSRRRTPTGTSGRPAR